MKTKNIKNIKGVRLDESNCFWTVSNSVEFTISNISSDSILTLVFIPFINSYKPIQEIIFSINENEIHRLTLSENLKCELSIRISQEFLNKSNNILTLEIPYAQSPKDLGCGEDEDDLGIYVQKIEILSLKEIEEIVYKKIEWGFQKSRILKNACIQIVESKILSEQLSEEALKKIISLSNIDDYIIDYFDKEKIIIIAQQPNIVEKIEKWTDSIHLFFEQILQINNHLTSIKISNYKPSQKLLDYYNHKLFTKNILKVRKNNLKLNSNEIRSHQIEMNSLPPYLFFSMINVCNLRCVMCYQSQIDFYKHLIPDDILVKIIEYIPYSYYISVSGLGEPTLAPNFGYFAKISERLRSYTYLISNGMNLDKMQDTISSFTEIAISFDAATKETFEIIRKGADFDKISKNIQSFRLKYPNVPLAFSSTISRLSLPEMSQIVEQAYILGVKTVNINAIYNTQNLELQKNDYNLFIKEKSKAEFLAKKYKIKLLIHINNPNFISFGSNLSKEEIIASLHRKTKKKISFQLENINSLLETYSIIDIPFQWDKIEKNSTNEFKNNIFEDNWDEIIHNQEKNIKNLKIKENTVHCLNPWNLLFVKEDGTVRLCCNSDRFMGNLNTHSIKEIYNNEIFKYARNSMIGKVEMFPECKTCCAGNRYLGKENLISKNIFQSLNKKLKL